MTQTTATSRPLSRGLSVFAKPRIVIRRGMTFTEMLLSMVLVAATLGGLQVLSASLRAETADEQTRRTLRALRAAAVLHHRLHQEGQISADAAAPMFTGPTSAALAALLAHPRTASLLSTVKIDPASPSGAAPPSGGGGGGGATTIGGTSGRGDALIVRDGYGRPIRYLPPTTTPAPRGEAASTAAGDFVSAGPDGRFGFDERLTPSATPATSGTTSGGGSGPTSGPTSGGADNLYGSDLETNP